MFADGPNGGNPCPVVFGADDWSSERMQEQARQFGVETVFVLAAQTAGDARLRYFVPMHEMEMCVHATVAASVLLGQAGRLSRNPAPIETPLGIRNVAWDAAASSAVVEQFPPDFGAPLPAPSRARVLAALRLADDDLADAGPIRSVSTARPKLMIAVRDERVLNSIDPRYELLWAVCDEVGVTGFYPFTLTAERADAAARQFPKRSGYNEDPATGVAACALSAYLAIHRPGARADGWNRCHVAQGRALGRPSLITAEAFVSGSGQVTATRVGGRMQCTES